MVDTQAKLLEHELTMKYLDNISIFCLIWHFVISPKW